jgi:hypothetical protein
MQRRSLLVVAALAPVAAHASAQDLLERLLDAIGGRARWAALRATLNDSLQHRLVEPLEVRARILMDFQQPRFRIDTEGQGAAAGLRLVRVLDGDVHWRRNREGALLPIPEPTLAEDRRWLAAHLYRTLARLARQDALLSVQLGAEGRLEVFEAGRRLLWLRCNARGEPVAQGAHESESPGLLGPWRFEVEGIRHPVWSSNADGSFRAELRELQVNPPLTEALFSRPPA